MQAIKRTVTTVQPGGRVEVALQGLEPGSEVEVLVIPAVRPPREGFTEFIGVGAGQFPNPGDIERYLREVRDGCPV